MRHLADAHIHQVNLYRRKFRANFQKLISEGIEAKEFRNDLKTDIVTFGILGMVNRSYNWFNPAGEISEEELTNIYLELIVNGIKNSSY